MTDWHEWYAGYDDPTSALSRRLDEVRVQVARLLDSSEPDPRHQLSRDPRLDDDPLQVVSMCAGDGRDLLPLLAERLAAAGPRIRALLVELDPELAATARAGAAEAHLDGVEVRTADAGLTDSYVDHVPADLLLACGVFGNVDTAGVARLIGALPALLAPGAHVVWTRGVDAPADAIDPVTHADPAPAVSTAGTADGALANSSADNDDDPAERVRAMFTAAGFEEIAFVCPPDATYRVGVHRLSHPPTTFVPGLHLFDFV